MLGKEIDSLTMHKIFQFVCMFNHTITKLDNNRSTFSHIAKGITDQPLQFEELIALAESDDKVKSHSNDKKSSNKKEAENVSIGAIPTNISPDLERSVHDAKTIESHIIAWLPYYVKATDVHWSETTLYYATRVFSMASKYKFPYGLHNLTTYHAVPVIAALTDQIGIRYRHTLFKKKHIIYVDHMQIEIYRLNALMDIILRKKKTLETNIDNFCKKEKKRQESIKTLKEMWKSKLEAISKHSRLSTVLSKTIQNEAKKRFLAENLKTLGIESSSIGSQLARNWPSQGGEKASFLILMLI